MRKIYFILLLLIARPAISQGLLGIIPDASVNAIGGVAPAYSTGAADLYANPALLTSNKGFNITFSNYLPSDEFYFGSMFSSLELPNTLGFAALGITVINVNDILGYDEFGSYEGVFKNYQALVHAGYAYELDPLKIGVGIKYYYSIFTAHQGDNKGDGVGFDLGFTYNISADLVFGMVYRSDMKVHWGSYSDKIRKVLDFGFMYRPNLIKYNFSRLFLSFNQISGDPILANMGIELRPIQNLGFINYLALKGGVGRSPLEKRNIEIELAEYWDSTRFYAAGMDFDFNISQINTIISYSYLFRKILENKHVISTKFKF